MSSKSKKSAPVVEANSSDDDVDQVVAPPPAPVDEPKKKVKKERTPAQKEAFSKALSILKEKREAKAKDDKERYEKATQEEKERIAKEKYEKAKSHKKKLPPAPSYVTTGDLEKFKNDLLSAIPRYEPPKPEMEKPKKVEIVEPIKKNDTPIVPKVSVEKPVQKQLTGHELLDKLFFS